MGTTKEHAVGHDGLSDVPKTRTPPPSGNAGLSKSVKELSSEERENGHQRRYLKESSAEVSSDSDDSNR